MRSACQVSTDSMTPDALAASRSRPLPCETAIEREFGRKTMTTGMPMRSSPVTLAILVMPISAMNGRALFSVSAGSIVRWVPRL